MASCAFILLVSALKVRSRYICLVIWMMMSLILMCSSYQNFSWTEDMFIVGSPMSTVLCWLSMFIIMCSSLATISERSPWYWLSITFMAGVLISCFSMSNLISFYVMFEVSLIPMVMLIIGWGYQPERLMATSYMVMYTVVASLPMLLVILHIFYTYESLNIYTLKCLLVSINPVVLLVLMLPFLVKLPIYGLHLWLPKAHVEAPLAGSMILAGVLLKLGGYGLFLITLLFFSEEAIKITAVIMLAIWGSLLASVMCMRQNDLKAMVAYSSVVHMGVVVLGILKGLQWGIFGSLLMMLSHGFVSSALFLAAYMTYKKVGSRSLSYVSGMLFLYPFMAMLWFILCSLNMGIPPSLNLISEVVMIPVAWVLSMGSVIVIGFFMFISAAYNMYMYSLVNHGMVKPNLLPSTLTGEAMLLSLMIHIMPMMFLFKMSGIVKW
uniref:NADH-ubiquinone oxidoreductase chain 4 n=1 Tax=Cerion incanum TaxID=145432 RepID=A0A0A0QYN1_9EUPU|nr:NADH dehydrogenase subunit 4 [Cerion incanum]AIU94462.1 NADH dehydrogenase subunit 4 [Cerion incanum]